MHHVATVIKKLYTVFDADERVSIVHMSRKMYQKYMRVCVCVRVRIVHVLCKMYHMYMYICTYML